MGNIQGSLKASNIISLNDIEKGMNVSIRDKVHAFEAIANQHEQVKLEVKHYFSKGVYARELHIPQGVILTGHIHKYENLNIISKGKIRVLVDDKLVDIEAPFTIVSLPGTKRIAIALEDTIWTTIHGTEERDLDLIEQMFIAHTEAEYLEFEKQLRLPFTDKDIANRAIKHVGEYLDY